MDDNRTLKLIEELSKMADEQQALAIEKFEKDHGRKYDGNSDKDWDLLDKQYTVLESAVNVIQRLHIDGVVLDDGPVTINRNTMSKSMFEYYTRPRVRS